MADSVALASDQPAPKLTGVQWLICVIASIGFAFDIYEVLMAPLVLPFALPELGGLRPGSKDFLDWVGRLFYIPAICGGIFGLLGGYLTDRLGRRRVLTWSILLYAFSAFFAGFSTNLWMLLILRCTTFVGVCVEFVAAVAWLAELFPDPRQREKVLGYTQAFSSIGGLLVGSANYLAVHYGANLPAIHLPSWLHFGAEVGGHDAHAAWRYTLMSGLIPAIPLIIIRPFLPESPVWKQKRDAGTLKRPSLAALFSPELARTTIVTTIMFACSYGAAFGAIQQMPQMVMALPEVQKSVAEAVAKLPATATRPASRPAGESAATAPAAAASTAAATTTPAATRPIVAADPRAVAKPPAAGGPAAPDPRRAVSTKIRNDNASRISLMQEIGGLLGRIALAVLALRIVSRGRLIRVFQIPGLIIFPVVFGLLAHQSQVAFTIGMFFAGFVTVAQFSFWGNYLPRVYPVHLRGTGESFAANIGGRMIGTGFAFVTTSIAAMRTPNPDNPNPVQAAMVMATTAAAIGFAVYLVGLIASFFLPEPPLVEEPHA